MKSYGRKKNIILLLVVSVMLVMSGCSGDKNAADIETESKSEAATTVETLQETEAQVAEGSTLVVGTFNIDVKAKEYVTPEQKQIMEDYGVDIFGIQEVDRNITRFDIEVYDPLTDFQQDPYTDSYFGLSIAKGDGQYGNAIISKYALSDTSVTQLYGVEEAPEDVQAQYFEIYENYDASSEEGAASMMLVWGEGGLVSQGAIEPRSYSRAVIEKDGKKIAFYTTHLSVESQEIRTKQLEQLRDALDTDEAEYRIVVGDFNTDGGINEYNVFTNAGYKLANGNNGVWLETMSEEDSARESLETSMSVKFLDNIIVSQNITINHVEAVQTDLSDHYPVIAELTLD